MAVSTSAGPALLHADFRYADRDAAYTANGYYIFNNS